MITLRNKNEYVTTELDSLIIKVKAIIYARVSTQDQAQHGYSLESQVDRCKELAVNKFNYKEDELIALIEEGEMGDDPNRPALNHALFLLEQGVGKKFIMLHPDRMSRYSSLQNQIAERVWSCGADLEFVEMSVDPNNPESMFMFNIQGAVSQYNKAKILANSKRGRLQKAKNGQISGLRRVYGYTFDKDQDILVENNHEKEIYLKMVDLLLNHDYSLADIARYLSLRNVPAPIGNVWYSSVISRILKNEVYVGRYYYGKTEIVQKQGTKTSVKKPREQWSAINIPAYIDEDLYQQIRNKLLSQAKKKPGTKSIIPYLLKGIAYCGVCGSHLVAGTPYRNKTTKELISGYYKCSQKQTHAFVVGTGELKHNCKSVKWRQDVVDDFVWHYLQKMMADKDTIVKIKELTETRKNPKHIQALIDKRNEIEAIIKEKNKAKEKIIFGFMSDWYDQEESNRRMEPIKNDLSILSNEILKINKEIEILDIPTDQMEIAYERIKRFQVEFFENDVSFERKSELINQIVTKVVIYDSTIDILTDWGKFLPYNSCNSQNKSMNYKTKIPTSITLKDQIYLPSRDITKDEFKIRFNNLTYDDVELIKGMYYELLKEIDDICQETNLSRETVVSIITLKNKRSLAHNYKNKRERDFDLIYDLHFKKEMSLKEIYRRYGYSTVYSKRVLEERGYTIINRWLKKNRDSGQAIEE